MQDIAAACSMTGFRACHTTMPIRPIMECLPMSCTGADAVPASLGFLQPSLRQLGRHSGHGACELACNLGSQLRVASQHAHFMNPPAEIACCCCSTTPIVKFSCPRDPKCLSGRWMEFSSLQSLGQLVYRHRGSGSGSSLCSSA